LRIVNRVVPSTNTLDGPHLFTKVNGKRLATPLFAVLVLVELTDLIFAVDSVPAVLAVSHEQFIVFSSNAFAILGLRSMYFLLAGVVEKFRYLRTGLAIVLTFIGLKMLVVAIGYHIPIWFSLTFVALVLIGSVVASLIIPAKPDLTMKVHLPPDFNLPPGEELADADTDEVEGAETGREVSSDEVEDEDDEA
ncbi:MAG TPA: hypothetical protein VGW58_19435, partial [Pyrinomonadaceae bacterium]|nr:hypothetical protein [Pyrinomonadaceae bacterium]